jgi:hypothetical protein
MPRKQLKLLALIDLNYARVAKFTFQDSVDFPRVRRWHYFGQFQTSQFPIYLAKEHPALATLDPAGSHQPVRRLAFDGSSRDLDDEIEDRPLNFQWHATSLRDT